MQTGHMQPTGHQFDIPALKKQYLTTVVQLELQGEIIRMITRILLKGQCDNIRHEETE